MAGRPSKFTPERVAIILESIASGDPKGLAAGLAGVDPGTLNNWLEKGEDGEAGYSDFSIAYKKAEADGEKKYKKIIETAAVDTWQAAAWILERRYSGNWAKKAQADANTPPPEPKQTYSAELPEDDNQWQPAGNA